MQKHRTNLIAALMCVAIIALVIAPFVRAGEVYNRGSCATAALTGSGTWTNDNLYAAIKLVRIGCTGWPVAIDTVTVARVTGDAYAQTNTLCTIVLASNVGAQNISDTNSVIAAYMKYNDKLAITSHVGTGGVVFVEYITQKH
jgi:hypothetical protein